MVWRNVWMTKKINEELNASFHVRPVCWRNWRIYLLLKDKLHFTKWLQTKFYICYLKIFYMFLLLNWIEIPYNGEWYYIQQLYFFLQIIALSVLKYNIYLHETDKFGERRSFPRFSSFPPNRNAFYIF